MPLYAALRDHLVVHADLRVDDLGLAILQREGRVQEGVVLVGLSVDVKQELALFFVVVHCGLDAAHFISQRHWENTTDVVKGDARHVKVCLVEVDFEGLAFG